MKARTWQIVLAVFGLSIASCSKYPESPFSQRSASGQIVADRGVLDVSSSGTTSWDVPLEDGSLLVIQSFGITNRTGKQMVVSSGEVTMAGHTVIIFNAQTNSQDQSTFFTSGRYFIKFKSHIIPPHKDEGPPPRYLSSKRSPPHTNCRVQFGLFPRLWL